MSHVATAPLMTSEELLALPDDGVERDLIDGQLQEREMTKRNRRHSRATVRIARFLDAWVDNQMEGQGEVLAGEAAFRLRRDPDTTVGIDIAYISEELSSETPDAAFIIDGVPVLAVEILSPSDTYEGIVEKLEKYLETGVAVVWIVDPAFRCVTVHRPSASPRMFNETEELVGDPELPGFRVRVADLFSH
jgi:Uma2 family endonuclease